MHQQKKMLLKSRCIFILQTDGKNCGKICSTLNKTFFWLPTLVLVESMFSTLFSFVLRAFFSSIAAAFLIKIFFNFLSCFFFFFTVNTVKYCRSLDEWMRENLKERKLGEPERVRNKMNGFFREGENKKMKWELKAKRQGIF